MAVPQQLSASLPARTSATSDCDQEEVRMESWLDEHPGFFQNYLIRKGNRGMIDAWLVSHALPPGIRSTAASGENSESSSSVASASQNHQNCVSPATTATSASVGSASVATATAASTPTGSASKASPSSSGSGSGTPVRKISAHEFEKGGLTKPLFNTIDGAPTFLSPPAATSEVSGQIRKRSRNDVKGLDETELIFELVKDICNDLDVRRLCHKILQNVGLLTNADRYGNTAMR